jgi:hypothetical protein
MAVPGEGAGARVAQRVSGDPQAHDVRGQCDQYNERQKNVHL